MVDAPLAPGRICNNLDVEKTLSSVFVNWLAPALRFLLLQLCKENVERAFICHVDHFQAKGISIKLHMLKSDGLLYILRVHRLLSKEYCIFL